MKKNNETKTEFIYDENYVNDKIVFNEEKFKSLVPIDPDDERYWTGEQKRSNRKIKRLEAKINKKEYRRLKRSQTAKGPLRILVFWPARILTRIGVFVSKVVGVLCFFFTIIGIIYFVQTARSLIGTGFSFSNVGSLIFPILVALIPFAVFFGTALLTMLLRFLKQKTTF